MSTYFKNISEGIGTTLKGMSLTWRHLWHARRRRMSTDIRKGDFFDLQEGMVTIQYPQETIPIPDNGRYRLHNEMDDCIVCDKCVKVCPVDCIEIEPIRAIEEVGRASDGSPIRLYAAKFDIDMAKCCYCGLCTTVCPTECLTMTKTFDYSELDVRDMVYNYANITSAEADEKRRLLEQFQKEKEALKVAQKPATASEVTPNAPAAKPAFKPTIKPKPQTDIISEETVTPAAKPIFQPRKTESVKEKEESEETENTDLQKSIAPKLPFKPTIRPKVIVQTENESPVSKLPDQIPASAETPALETPVEPIVPAKPAFRPTMKPKVITDSNADFSPVSKASNQIPSTENSATETPVEQVVPAKPAFRPTMKPKANAVNPEPVESRPLEEATPVKPVFRPTMKPKVVNTVNPEPPKVELPVVTATPKPVFRPTMKPKVVEPVPEESTEPKAKNEQPVQGDAEQDKEEVVDKVEEIAKPKPAFRPTMKPKPKPE